MRVILLLVILAETAFIGHTLGEVADHYNYLAAVYGAGLTRCEQALDRLSQ